MLDFLQNNHVKNIFKEKKIFFKAVHLQHFLLVPDLLHLFVLNDIIDRKYLDCEVFVESLLVLAQVDSGEGAWNVMIGSRSRLLVTTQTTV